MTYDPAVFERAEALIREAKVQFIDLQFSDIVGIVKQVTIPTHQWPQAVQHGIWFDGQEVQHLLKLLAEKSPDKQESSRQVMDYLADVFKY